MNAEKVCQREAKNTSEDKDGVTQGDCHDDAQEGTETGAAGFPDGEKRSKGSSSPGNRKDGKPPLLVCQVENCVADFRDAKRYHRRHKVCEVHAKAPTVMVAGIRKRFCQQCSRFQEVGEFDESKRSCRRRLAGHNQRRRKSGVGGDYGENLSHYSPGSSQTKANVIKPTEATETRS